MDEVVEQEATSAGNDKIYWSFLKTEERSGRKEERAVVETKEGDLERLLSMNDQPLTSNQQEEESDRIQKLLRNPSKRQKLQRDQRKDSQQTTEMLKLLPRALLFNYAEQHANSIELTFKPNPGFHPQSYEAKVLNALGGQIWINNKEKRIEEIQGHLIHDVRFLGGFGGHLQKGGQFFVRQTEIAPGHWQLTTLNVDMQGKALFFKNISVKQFESRSHFHKVSSDLTLSQAAQMLSHWKPDARTAEK